jgi:superfamily II DNA/RNA helicase
LNDQDAFEAAAAAQPDATPAEQTVATIPNRQAPDSISTEAAPASDEHDRAGKAAEAESRIISQPVTKHDAADAGDQPSFDSSGHEARGAATPVHVEPAIQAPELKTAAAATVELLPAALLFSDTGLSDPILQAIAEKGYLHPTPIQAQAIPVVLAGRDVLGVAQTGTGKTASFVLPMMDILSGSRARARMPRSLILEPTRELALQVAENFVLYGKHLKLNHALLIGGESMNDQKDALMKGVDVLIATPGRLLDLFERGGLLLTDCRVLVIDEADRMLDMGFIPDVEKIVGFLPKNRQTLFFSATMSPEIERLTKAFLSNPKMITVSKSATVATTIVAGLALVAEHDKREALRQLIRSEEVQSALIFCNRKRDVDVLYKSLTKHGFSVGSLHGDMPQPARFATLEKFKAGEIRLLVCSDVAARGIDIGGLSHVFNFDVPHHCEDYVHRIGRTGRAGKTGAAFTLAGPDDRLAVEAIEKLTGNAIPRIAVPGLDVVDWAEGDSRKRRGRGGSSAAPKSGRAPRDSKAPASPRQAEKPEAEKTIEGEIRSPRSRGRSREKAPVRESEGSMRADIRAEVAPRPEVAREIRPEPGATPRPEARADARPETRAESRAEPRHSSREDSYRNRDRRPEPAPEPASDFRAAREPRRYRDEDLGPSVQGFGEEIPAFMLLPKRGQRVTEDVV